MAADGDRHGLHLLRHAQARNQSAGLAALKHDRQRLFRLECSGATQSAELPKVHRRTASTACLPSSWGLSGVRQT
jgi:hypothetical protein